MTAVWKYAIDVSPYAANGGQVFQVPTGASFRACAAQGGAIALWFEVDTEEPDRETRWFRFFGTGFALQGEDLTYLGTCLFADGALVLHVYEASR